MKVVNKQSHFNKWMRSPLPAEMFS